MKTANIVPTNDSLIDLDELVNNLQNLSDFIIQELQEFILS